MWNFIRNVMRSILGFLYKLFNKEMTDNQFEAIMQFVKFGIVGVSNTFISYVLYTGCLLLFKTYSLFPSGDYLIAQIISFILSVLWSFYWNNKYVFKVQNGESRNLFSALIKTYISYSFTGLFLSSALLVLWVDILHINEFIAPLINLIVSVPLNFLINKFWAFKNK